MEYNLKPFPFCGGEADLYRRGGRYGYFMYVECSICSGQTRTFSDGNSDEEDWNSVAARRARDAWNRRIGGGADAESDT